MSGATILVGGQAKAEIRDVAASGAITPGYLVEHTGDNDTVQAHSTDGAPGVALFADIVPYSGDRDDDTADPVDDAYADGDYVKTFVADIGNRVNAIASEEIAYGDLLVSNGDGRLRTYVTADDDAGAVLCKARSAAAAADDRVLAERL